MHIRRMFQLVKSWKRFCKLPKNSLRMKYASGVLLVSLLIFWFPVHNDSAAFKVNLPNKAPVNVQRRAVLHESPNKEKPQSSAKDTPNEEENKIDDKNIPILKISDIKTAFRPWLQNECKPVRRLLSRKELMIKRLLQTVDKISRSSEFNPEEKKYHIQAFRIFSKVWWVHFGFCLVTDKRFVLMKEVAYCYNKNLQYSWD